MKKLAVALAAIATLATAAFAHSGGTDAYGCHTEHKTGLYHCQALLHKSSDKRTSPIPGQTHPTA